jgi:hypothetical protein
MIWKPRVHLPCQNPQTRTLCIRGAEKLLLPGTKAGPFRCLALCVSQHWYLTTFMDPRPGACLLQPECLRPLMVWAWPCEHTQYWLHSCHGPRAMFISPRLTHVMNWHHSKGIYRSLLPRSPGSMDHSLSIASNCNSGRLSCLNELAGSLHTSLQAPFFTLQCLFVPRVGRQLQVQQPAATVTPANQASAIGGCSYLPQESVSYIKIHLNAVYCGILQL